MVFGAGPSAATPNRLSAVARQFLKHRFFRMCGQFSEAQKQELDYRPFRS